jgi:hypothetical protein
MNWGSFTWNFTRCSDAAAQVKEARIWAGIHFPNSCNVGEAIGVAIGDYVLSHFLLPIDEDQQQTWKKPALPPINR